MKPKKLSQDQIQSTLTSAIKDAVAFVESEVAPDRIKAQRYFDGEVDLSHEEGRSKVVATKCRDTIRAVKPSLMRVFLQTARPVEFVPRRPQAVQEADAKTQYAAYVFDRNDGFMLLSDAFDDALKKKVGILKAWYDETQDVEVDEYTGLSQEQIAFLESDPEIEIIEQDAEDAGMGPDGLPVMSYSAKVARTSRRGQIKIKAVAPEDFFVDRSATSIDDCYVCGHSTESRVGEVVDMGFDFEEVYELAGTGDSSVDEEEELTRRGWDSEADEDANDPSMKKVVLTEAYMKMDIEGTGIPRLYKFICASEKYTILDYELADVNPFAVFEVDPEAHTFFGRSLVDIIIDDQDAATSMLRGLLDNIAMVNNPRLEVVTGSIVNMDDVLNNEIGGIIRVKTPGSVREMTIGGMATSVLPAIGYYDEVIRAKTGVSGAGMGMDADVLQSQTAQGVNAAVQAANQVSELIARHLAEGGMKRLFKIIAQLARQHPDSEEMMRVNGQFVPVDPRSWTADADLICNVGLGTGKHEERSMVLREVLQNQMGIWQSYGPQNGVVTLTNIRNTLSDILSHSGLHNAERYYAAMDPQKEQMLLQQAAQAQQGQAQGSDPNAAFLQAEQAKVSARVMTDQQRNALEEKKAYMADDRERDKMAQELFLGVAEIAAKTGAQMNTAQLKAEQAAMRQPMQPMMQP